MEIAVEDAWASDEEMAWVAPTPPPQTDQEPIASARRCMDVLLVLIEAFTRCLEASYRALEEMHASHVALERMMRRAVDAASANGLLPDNLDAAFSSEDASVGAETTVGGQDEDTDSNEQENASSVAAKRKACDAEPEENSKKLKQQPEN